MRAIGTLRTSAHDVDSALRPVVTATLRIAVLIAIAMFLILVLLPGALGAADIPLALAA